MTREDARKAAEVMLAYADGKEVGFYIDDKWEPIPDPSFNWEDNLKYYCIKPEPKYRPFKDAEECWQEMQKHQPFGWVKDISDGTYFMITKVRNGYCMVQDIPVNFDTLNMQYIFADDEPIGVKE